MTEIVQPASAFMIDLAQVSLALRGVTSRSLLILDEFGKGTSINVEDRSLRHERYKRLRWCGIIGGYAPIPDRYMSSKNGSHDAFPVRLLLLGGTR